MLLLNLASSLIILNLFQFFLHQFAVLLSLIIVAEIAAAIAGYVFRNKVSAEFHSFFNVI